MRKIKFRAWDGERMIYRELHDRNWYSEDLGGKLVKGTHPDDSRLLYTMQFTGLKDKNGKDIYEGDIVHYEGITSNGNPVIRKVVYNSERAQFMAEMYQIECPSMAKCTIIGNIHDNPELLK